MTEIGTLFGFREKSGGRMKKEGTRRRRRKEEKNTNEVEKNLKSIRFETGDIFTL